MYKIDLKTLNEITNTFDLLDSDIDYKTFNKFVKRAQKLSKKIKDNYTQIKP
jgi:hypothetical protein